MVIIRTLEEFKTIPQTKLVDYLKERYIHLMQEYSCSMNDIGEVNIYQNNSEFLLNELNPTTYELIEVIKIFNRDYLHLVELVDDYYAKDIYIPIQIREVV